MADVLKEIGFRQSEADACLFIKERRNCKLMLALYVDDGLVAGTNPKVINEFIDELKLKLKINTKPATYFLGIEIETREDGILINQFSYTKKILRQFGMENCRPVMTPIVKDSDNQNHNVMKDDINIRYTKEL